MDIQYLLFLQKIRELCGEVMDSFLLEVTALGEQTVTFLLLSFVYWCIDKRAGQRMGLNVALACTWNQFIKWKCKIERPWIRDERIVPVQGALAGAGGYSFPSGHTTRVTAVWGALGAYLWKSKERMISVICWCVVALVAFSRNLLGVHTPQDVLFAFGMGIAVILAADKALDFAENGKNRDIWIMAAGCLFCFLPMLKAGCLTNAGAGMGFFIGWLLERRFIHFDSTGTWQQKAVRFSVGGAGILFILYVLKNALNLFMEAKYAGFFTTFSLAVFIMAVYPFFFSRKERYQKGVCLAVACIVGILLLSVWQTHVKNEKTAQENAAEEMAEMAETAEGQEIQDETNAPEEMQETAVNQQEMQDEAAILQEVSEKEAVLPQIIAHRGYSSEFPENTLASFAGAFDIGVDYIELDVQITKDGEIVVFHDTALSRITGKEGTISDYTYEELLQMDAGSWFDSSFAGERIPTLRQALELTAQNSGKVYLELKDIGEVDGFEEAVLEITKQCKMTEQCIFASFRYDYLVHLKEMDASVQTLYNTLSGKTNLAEEFPADYYGLYIETITAETVGALHQAGKQVFVWTANTPVELTAVQAMGVDGVVTNYPGLAKVILNSQYRYLSDHFEASVTLPGLYGANLPEMCADMIVQGFTKAGNVLVVSAYSKSGEYNSILYLMDINGKLKKIVDLGFQAHTGGISYDETHDLLWVTGASGMVYALSWPDILNGVYEGEIKVNFDAGLVNHNGSKVASFLTYDGGFLYVGSYVDGADGVLNRYDISNAQNPVLVSSVSIPQRIQGVTFKEDVQSGVKYMYLSQGYQTEDAALLMFIYDEQLTEYDEPLEINVLPEGAEQIQMTAKGMYILFESAARPYRATAGIPNDQIYLVRE